MKNPFPRTAVSCSLPGIPTGRFSPDRAVHWGYISGWECPGSGHGGDAPYPVGPELLEALLGCCRQTVLPSNQVVPVRYPVDGAHTGQPLVSLVFYSNLQDS